MRGLLRRGIFRFRCPCGRVVRVRGESGIGFLAGLGTSVGRVFEGEANDACLTARGALTVDMTLWNETIAEHHCAIPVREEGTYSE